MYVVRGVMNCIRLHESHPHVQARFSEWHTPCMWQPVVDHNVNTQYRFPRSPLRDIWTTTFMLLHDLQQPQPEHSGELPMPPPTSPLIVGVDLAQYRPLKSRLREHPADLLEMVSQVAESECSSVTVHLRSTNLGRSALHVLHYEWGMLHRDVSWTNTLWEPRANDGGAHFVLHDFDRPMQMSGDDSASGVQGALRHTGAFAFMAIDLLMDLRDPEKARTVKHHLYHDYESLFWVALWSAIKSEHAPSMEKEIQTAVSEWEPETGGYTYILGNKIRLLHTAAFVKLPFTPKFNDSKPLLWFLVEFRAVFCRAGDAIREESMNQYILGKDREPDWGPIEEAIQYEWIHRDKIQAVVEAWRGRVSA